MAEFCKGCGIKLQNTDKKALGYVPNLDADYCQRCFKLTHYGTLTINMQQGIASETTFSKINALNAVIFWVVDLFSFEASLIPSLNEKLPGKDIILILTKRDVLPKTLSDEKIYEFVDERLQKEKISVKDMLICGHMLKKSEISMECVDEISWAIANYRENKDVVFMGMANVGKSTLLNQLVEDSGITTSRNPGTTLDLIPLYQEEGFTIYDTPGIENPNSMLSILPPEELKQVIPTKPIRPFVSQIYENQSFAVGGLARVDFKVKGNASVVGYFSRDLDIHRGKLDDADRLWNMHINKMLKPSVDKTVDTMRVWKAPRIKKDEKMDIVIHGVGWFCVNGKIDEISVKVHDGITVSFRKAMI
ncbi:MAG: ribosome biogenesis GTPase YqeH [Bacillota bacterium]|nr:ribosome biogenesis GTPase YqeH [Bacillota bacterium]